MKVDNEFSNDNPLMMDLSLFYSQDSQQAIWVVRFEVVKDAIPIWASIIEYYCYDTKSETIRDCRTDREVLNLFDIRLAK